jgi:putative transposase
MGEQWQRGGKTRFEAASLDLSLEHYHRERNHQGKNNRILVPCEEVGRAAGEIQCRERLGGLLRYYYRAAA